jgi:hypothetical protein
VIADLLFHNGESFGRYFEFYWSASPYILVDIVTAAAIEIIGPQITAQLLSIFGTVLIPVSVVSCSRRLGLQECTALLAGLLVTPLAVDFTFAAGYLAFKYSTALSILSTGLLAEHLVKPSGRSLTKLGVAIVATFLAHLSGFVVFCFSLMALSLADIAARRTISKGVITAALIVVGIGLIHVYHESISTVPSSPYQFGTLSEKYYGLISSLAVTESAIEGYLNYASLALLALSAFLISRVTEETSRKVFLLILSAGAAYLVLPQSQPGFTYDTDMRALPYVFSFCAIGLAVVLDTHWRLQVFVGGTTFALAIAHLASIALPQLAQADRLASFRQACQAVPLHSRVFPIVTTKPVSGLVPFGHASAYALVDRDALVPYLFEGTHGSHMRHFRRRSRPDSLVPNMWYVRQNHVPDWPTIARDFDHVLATRPVDTDRIGLCMTLVQETDAAVVFRIDGLKTDSSSCEQSETGAN